MIRKTVEMLPPPDAVGVRYGDRTPAPGEPVLVDEIDVDSLEAEGWRRVAAITTEEA
jgi:hypothetical protein